MIGRERDGVALKLERDADLRSQSHVFETCHEAEIQVKLSWRHSDSRVQHADEVTKIQNDCRAKGKKDGFFSYPVYINSKDLVLLSYEHTFSEMSV